MKINIPWWIAHHALKLAFATYVTNVVADNIGQLHWAFKATEAVAGFLSICAVLIGAIHAYKGSCPRCRRKPADQLTRPHYKAVIHISRYGGHPVAALWILWLVLTPLLTDKKTWEAGTELNGPVILSRIILFSTLILFLACVRFDRTHYPDHPRKARLTSFLMKRGQTLVHRSHWLCLGLCILAAPASFLPDWGIGNSIDLILLLLLCGVFYVNQRHAMILCEQCVTEFRPDAAEYAAHRGWRFTVAHHSDYPMLALAVLVTITPLILPRFWVNLGYAVVFPLFGLQALLLRFHSAYQPWCPYCRRGGGGGGDTDPVDAPDPSTRQPAPA